MIRDATADDHLKNGAGKQFTTVTEEFPLLRQFYLR
jgi:hypothetical protein